MNQRIYLCRKKMALLLSCLMLAFTIMSNAGQVFAADTILTGTSGTISWKLDTLTGRLTISGSGTLENVSDMLGTQEGRKLSCQVKKS